MWLVVGITGLSLLGWFVNTYPPDSFIRILIFFAILGGTTFCISFFFLKIVRRATIITVGVIVWLLLRYLGLRDWYYPLLLLPILISLEMLFQKR
jgi:hypothetical protein